MSERDWCDDYDMDGELVSTRCPKCGEMVKETDDLCPKCGFDVWGYLLHAYGIEG